MSSHEPPFHQIRVAEAWDETDTMRAIRLDFAGLASAHTRPGQIVKLHAPGHRPGYFALAPVDRDLVNINFVVDKSAAAAAKGDVEGFYRRHLEANPRLAPRLKGATLVGKVRATGLMARRTGRGKASRSA